MNISAVVLGNKLRHAREFMNYSQEYVAAKLGVTQSTYSRWEKGEVLPKVGALELAAEVLNIPFQSLFNAEPFILTQRTAVGDAGNVQPQHKEPVEAMNKMLGQHQEQLSRLEALCNRLAEIIAGQKK